jgi:hypothetical protein
VEVRRTSWLVVEAERIGSGARFEEGTRGERDGQGVVGTNK